MAWNPSPKVADCRDIGKKWDRDIVIIFAVSADGQLEYASYGKTRALCDEAQRLADTAFDAIMGEG